jgi:hypothetical protein
MKKYHIYSRDESGIMEYMGVKEFESINQVIEYYCVTDADPEVATLLGWPTKELTWYGSVGIAPA